MPVHFDLIITADYPNRSAELRLLDQHGSQLAFRQTSFQSIAASRLQGLFNLREYLSHYVEPGREIASVAEIGVCIAEEVLGEKIFRKLWESESQRTLRIQLPGATEEENPLAAALARVPWEIARPAPGQPTLGERNLLVRVVHDMQASQSTPIEFAKDECLRVLFVFAEARGSRPLAARQERHALRQLFEKEIYPNRRVVADFLTHGVTRERLKSQIEENGGYHIVHWSGHGHLNLLELAKPGGAGDRLSGDQLLDLFTGSGGFIPRLFFLSACHSGDILRAKDWNEFMAIAQGKEIVSGKALAAGLYSQEAPAASALPLTENATKQITFDAQPGYTGTAHALLQGGVSSVVAMRYAVGDDYARELGIEFYRALLAHTKPKSVAEALTMARNSLLDPKKHDGARYSVCDHATPLLYGAEQLGLTLQKGRSPGLDTRNPRLHQITELTTAGHEHFVGRTWELAELGSDFIGSSRGSEVKPVAVISGLGGMGKTALTAESLALWESRFEWVLLYQAKPNPLSFEATLRNIHMKLYGELGRYHDHVQARPADAIHRDASAEFTGPERLERLTRNLIRALKDEPILLVLDNFETNLKPIADCRLSLRESGATDDAAFAERKTTQCQDPAWDRCLALLATELIDAPSRVLINCRRPLAVLPETVAHHVLLGPLPSGEAALYLRQHAGLSKMLFSSNVGEKALAMRLLTASRFLPLLMDRLARLAVGGESLRPQLLQALDALETSHDYSQLPELFATDPGDAKELAYLNDALATSLDQLIHEASPDARRLLWMIALANDPVALGLLRGVWSGEEGPQKSQLRLMKKMLSKLSLLPAEVRSQVEKAFTPRLLTQLERLSTEPPLLRPQPNITPVLQYLISVGLATEERIGPNDNNAVVTCHELVRERIVAWMKKRPPDRGVLTVNSIRLAYAEWLEAAFETLIRQDMTAALEVGSRAVVYCVQAEAWDQLGGLASAVVGNTTDSRLLDVLLPHLHFAAESAPDGKSLAQCLGILAIAIKNCGYPLASLPFFERSVEIFRKDPAFDAMGSRGVWNDLAAIYGDWADALRQTGFLEVARQRCLDGAEASKKANKPPVDFISYEIQALRIDIVQGRAAEAVPQIEARIVQLESWWNQIRGGNFVGDAPNPEQLTGVLIEALDVMNDVHFSQNEWVSALRRVDEIMEIKRVLRRPEFNVAITRLTRASVLGNLGRIGESIAELEACLQHFHSDPHLTATTRSSLARRFEALGDVVQSVTQERRALSLYEQFPLPSQRALSHGNLGNYLEAQGTPYAVAES